MAKMGWVKGQNRLLCLAVWHGGSPTVCCECMVSCLLEATLLCVSLGQSVEVPAT